MTTPVETVGDSGSKLKWLAVAALMLAAAVVNPLLPELNLALRGLIMGALGLAALAVAATTLQGKSFIDMLQQSRVELRKVVWPTRQETTQTTLIVLVVVVVMSLLLWGMDSLFGWAISAVIG